MHSPSLLFTCMHSPSLLFTCMHSPSPLRTHLHFYSLAFTSIHSPSLVRTRLHFYPLTRLHLYRKRLHTPGETTSHSGRIDSGSGRNDRKSSVLIKNKHSDLVSHIKSASLNIILCHLKRQLFGISSDIYLAAVYLSPLHSQ